MDTGKVVGTGKIKGPTKVVLPKIRVPRQNASEGVPVETKKPEPIKKEGG